MITTTFEFTKMDEALAFAKKAAKLLAREGTVKVTTKPTIVVTLSRPLALAVSRI